MSVLRIKNYRPGKKEKPPMRETRRLRNESTTNILTQEESKMLTICQSCGDMIEWETTAPKNFKCRLCGAKGNKLRTCDLATAQKISHAIKEAKK